MDWPIRFGIFLAPFHRPGQNPTLALERDLQLIEHLDRLGYEEAWIGEHHSGGWELIASPEVFIAAAAGRTRHIKLGTGVSSLPYHHPLLLVDRMVLLDHLTRGRVMFGVGPGQLASDAHMLGIDTNEQRRMMEESLEVIVELLDGKTVSRTTDWFTMQDARLQLRPFSHPRFEIAVAASFSPSGPKTAARFGAGLLSIAATQEQGFDALGYHWGVMEETAERHGTTVDRRAWRLMGPMHIAETEEQARREVVFGLEGVQDYLQHVLPIPHVEYESLDQRIDEGNRTGSFVVGTPDMAIAQIERLRKQSGGFGAYLFMGADWANREATFRSYELFAREVMPQFQGQSDPPMASEAWVRGSGEWIERTAAAIGKAVTDYEQEKGMPAAAPNP
jgi:limonene 1,2-monooxygenase